MRPNTQATLQTVPSVYTDAATTRGGNVDNLLPNPTSEKDPPSDADASRPEWVGRFDPGAGNGFGGSRWVRRINTAIHAPVLLGDRQTTPAADQSQLGVFIPCIQGDQFYVEAQVKIAARSGTDRAGVYMWFLDDTNSQVGVAASATDTGTTGAYAKCFAQGVAPSGAVKVLIGGFAGCATGSIDVHYDALYARRQIDSSIGIPPSFQTPTLATHYTFSIDALGYWKTIDGAVRFKGDVNFDGNGGAWNQVVFTLPVGYRPLVFSSFVLPTASLGTYITCTIATNGDVRFEIAAVGPFLCYASSVDFQLA